MERRTLERMVQGGCIPVPTRALTGDPWVDKRESRAPHRCRPSEETEQTRLKMLGWVDEAQRDGCGLAIWLDNWLVLDCDSDLAAEWHQHRLTMPVDARRRLPEAPVLVREGVGGLGRYKAWYWAPDVRKTRMFNAPVKGMDVLTTGLAQIEQHWSGSRYHWAGRPPWEWRVDAPEWLVHWVNACKPLPSLAVPTAPLPGVVDVQDVRNYCSVVPPAQEGKGGLAATLKLSMNLARKFRGLTTGQIVEGMLLWNDQCNPPWEVSELTQLVESAQRKVG